MAVFLYFIFLLGSAIYDGWLWRSGNYIGKKGHLARATIRLVVFSALAVSLYDPSIGPHASSALIPYLILMATGWWILFDPLVNIFAGKKVFHLGKSAFTDAVFWKIGKEYLPSILIQYTIKALALALALWLNSGDGFTWFMDHARRFYFNSIW